MIKGAQTILMILEEIEKKLLVIEGLESNFLAMELKQISSIAQEFLEFQGAMGPSGPRMMVEPSEIINRLHDQLKRARLEGRDVLGIILTYEEIEALQGYYGSMSSLQIKESDPSHSYHHMSYHGIKIYVKRNYFPDLILEDDLR